MKKYKRKKKSNGLVDQLLVIIIAGSLFAIFWMSRQDRTVITANNFVFPTYPQDHAKKTLQLIHFIPSATPTPIPSPTPLPTNTPIPQPTPTRSPFPPTATPTPRPTRIPTPTSIVPTLTTNPYGVN